MSLAILDARQWQRTVDLRSGRQVVADGPLVDMVQGLVARHPFPGDRDPAGNAWVVDTALDLVAAYAPRFVFLTLARQYYSARYSPLSAEERAVMAREALAEAERFARASGFFTVVVGSGGLTPATASIDLSDLDGLAVASNWSARYAGLYDPTDRDMARLSALAGLERLATREDILRLFGGGPGDGARLPDVMVVAREGYFYKNTSLRRLLMIPARNTRIPVSANLGQVEAITDIKARIMAALAAGEKVALVLLEGLGEADFTIPYTTCRNGLDWYCYEPVEAQYLALTTGRHAVFEHNGGYRYFLDDTEHKPYPFSGYFTALPTGTIGQEFAGRSIAVGNRSMFMHVTTGCDIACECFARNLYNQGVMAVIHRQDKAAAL